VSLGRAIDSSLNVYKSISSEISFSCEITTIMEWVGWLATVFGSDMPSSVSNERGGHRYGLHIGRHNFHFDFIVEAILIIIMDLRHMISLVSACARSQYPPFIASRPMFTF